MRRDGLLLFIKYAFAPNVLQFCGPADTGSFFDALTNVKVEKIRSLLSKFYCAVPYLQLIAQSNGIKDPFDYRAVEAYWLGNGLLKNVKTKDVYSHVEGRFKKSLARKDWFWLVSESVTQAKPFHGFHVFDIYRREGLLKSGVVEKVLNSMDKCRIAWGRVETVNLFSSTGKKPFSGTALVKYNPLEFNGKQLFLGKEAVREVCLIDSSVKAGDEVSLHWEYACDKITVRQKHNLIYWTKYHLNLANKTV